MPRNTEATWTTAQAAKAWGVTRARAARLASAVPGAEKAWGRWGWEWRIPSGSEQPPDPANKGVQLSQANWEQLKKRMENGETAWDLAEECGLKVDSIYVRRSRERKKNQDTSSS